MIRENVDSKIGTHAAACWSVASTRLRNRALSAATMARPRLALRRYGGMISRMVFEMKVLEGMDMQKDSIEIGWLS